MVAYRRTAAEPDAIGRAIRTAIEQPADGGTNEIVGRTLTTRALAAETQVVCLLPLSFKDASGFESRCPF